MTSHLGGLNDPQKEAALHKEGPLLVVAGAGAGKTKTLTTRIINLISEGVPAGEILAVTFTNKAAQEIRERVSNELKKINAGKSGNPFLGTFHSLGVHIIKENSKKIGVTEHFTILDEQDAISLIKQALAEKGLDPKQYEPRKIKNIISRNKGDSITVENFEPGAATQFEKVVYSVWKRYEELKQKENSLDFDDLLLKPALLLQKDSDVRNQYQNKWRYIHIDEYQDTNAVQYQLSRLLAENHKNICVVGDGDQNIYSWRGANIQNILRFERDYPGAKVVMLEENYRSTKNILDAANAIIKKNTLRVDKNLFTQNKTGEKISLFEGMDEVEEAKFVARKAGELLESGVPGADIAVLYRANFQSRVLEEAFLMENIPYQVLGVKFFERKEVKDVISYIRAALNRESSADIKRIINFPARGIGKTTLEKIFADKFSELPAGMQKKVNAFYDLLKEIGEIAAISSPSETIKFIVKKTGIEELLKHGTEEDLERLENIRELATLALKYDTLPQGEGIAKLIEDAALSSDQDSLLRDGNKASTGVKLMTVHASKGLEFPYVFIVGLEQDLFPHKKDGFRLNKDQEEEERRLFYVALTRAREKLYISYAAIRTIFGMKQINAPSEFLFDIPDELIEKDEASNSGYLGKTIYLD